MTYLPPPKTNGMFDPEWATQNNRVIQQELNKLGPLTTRVADLETGKQPIDGDLTAIAALTGTGYIRRTADDTWAISTTIPYASLSSIPAAIDAIDGLTPAADRLAYYTGAGTAALATLTSFGRSLIDDANASAGRTTLGLGTMSTQNANAVAITGGTINGASIGATTPSTGAFTTLSATTASTNVLTLTNTDAALWSNILFNTNGNDWELGARGSAAGARPNNFYLFDLASGVFRQSWDSTGTSITGTLSVSSTISASNLAGTTYTPTLRGTVDVNIASSTFQSASYIRVGTSVMATIQVLITPTAAGSVRFSISLPVASNLTNAYQLGGNCAARDTVPLAGMVIGSASNDNAVAEFVAATTNAHEVTVQVMYPIL